MHNLPPGCFLFVLWISPLQPVANKNLFFQSSFSKGKPTADFVADFQRRKQHQHPLRSGVLLAPCAGGGLGQLWS